MLALGDSYTIGESVAIDERWPVRLAALLRRHGIVVAEPTIIARTGWTTDELSGAIDATRPAPAGPYDVVTLLIGVNNQYRGRSADEYRQHFGALLRRAIGYAGSNASRVIVFSIPDWGVTPFAAQNGRDPSAVASEIDAFNAVNRDETETVGARYVDVTPVSRRAKTDPGLIAADGLHPSGSMYDAWARLALPVALEVLGRA